MQSLSFGAPTIKRLSAKARKVSSQTSTRVTPRRQLKQASAQKPKKASAQKSPRNSNNNNNSGMYFNATSTPNRAPQQNTPRSANHSTPRPLSPRDGLERLLCKVYAAADELYGGRGAFSEEVHRVVALYAGDIGVKVIAKQKNNIIKLTSAAVFGGLLWKMPQSIMNLFTQTKTLAAIGFLLKHTTRGGGMVELTEKQLATLLRSIKSKLPARATGAAAITVSKFLSIITFRLLRILPGPEYISIITRSIRNIIGSVFGIWLPLDRFHAVVHRNAASLESFMNQRTTLLPILKDLIQNELKPHEIIAIEKALERSREWGTKEMTTRLYTTLKISPKA